MEPLFSANDGAGVPVPMRNNDNVLGLEKRLDDAQRIPDNRQYMLPQDDDSAVMRAYQK